MSDFWSLAHFFYDVYVFYVFVYPAVLDFLRGQIVFWLGELGKEAVYWNQKRYKDG